METLARLEWVRARLLWMRQERAWPDGSRILSTDALGAVLLLSLFEADGDYGHRLQIRQLLMNVQRALGRERGMCSTDAEGPGIQSFRDLGMWMFALYRLGRIDETCRRRGIDLVHEIHDRFVQRGRGVHAEMHEHLGAPLSGTGWGELDPFLGYVVYRLLDELELARPIEEMHELVERRHRDLVLTRGVELGVMLWLTHFFPEEPWARLQRQRSLELLARRWVPEHGYFCWRPREHDPEWAVANHAIALGLQAIEEMPERVERLRMSLWEHRSRANDDRDAVGHVMACNACFPGLLLKGTAPFPVQAGQ